MTTTFGLEELFERILAIFLPSQTANGYLVNNCLE